MWRLVGNLSQLFDHIINVVRFNVCDWIEILVHEIWEQDQVINTANRWCYHPRWFHAPRFANGLTNPLPCSLLIFVPGQKSWNMRLNWCLTCHPPISLLKWRNEIDAEEIIVSEHEPQGAENVSTSVLSDFKFNCVSDFVAWEQQYYPMFTFSQSLQ